MFNLFPTWGVQLLIPPSLNFLWVFIITIFSKEFMILSFNVLGVVSIFVDDSLNQHLNCTACIIENLNVVATIIILSISSGPTTFNY